MGIFDLSGKTALVTGASMGLGVTFANALADAGADVALTARSAELLEAGAAAIAAKGRKATWHPGDVTVVDDVKRVVAEAIEQHGKIDILVNNAGLSNLQGLVSEHAEHDVFRQIIDVDLMGVWHFAREIGPHMLERGSGSIINIASILGSGGSEFTVTAYIAAKGAVIQLTKQLAVEWADRNVRVNVVSPAYFVTEMTRTLFEMLGLAPWIESRTPMRRLGDPEADLTGPIVFLASDASSYVTGLNLTVDGGWEASRGAWQLTPNNYFWNKDRMPVGTYYEGLVPNQFEQWKMGIPGLHYPMPEA